MRELGIFGRENGFGDAPVDGELRIIPGDAVFVLGKVIVAAFVKELDALGEAEEAVSEAGGNEDLILVGGGEMNSSPFAEVRRAGANVDGNVERFTFDDAAELGLRVFELVVQPAKGVFDRGGLIVLDEIGVHAQASQASLVVTLEEKAASVLDDFRTEFVDAGKFGVNPIHRVDS